MAKGLPKTNAITEIKTRLRHYWHTPLNAHYQDFAQRHLLYLLSAILFGILTYIAIVKAIGAGHLNLYWKYISFRRIYVMETAINFGLCIYLMEEWIRRITNRLRKNRKQHVHTVWAHWTLAFVLAFVLQETLVYARIDQYAPPVIDFLERYPLQRPAFITRLLVFAIIWYTVLQVRIGCGYWLQKLMQRSTPQPNTQDCTERQPGTTSPPKASTPGDRHALHISSGKKTITLQSQSISHVTSEGHYCRFYIRDNGTVKEIFTKVTLKTVISKLPTHDFVQIHRSHVINRRFVRKLKKANRTYQLFVEKIETPLPISRHRWPEIRRLLKPYNPSDGSPAISG